jgi:hypothetical protein
MERQESSIIDRDSVNIDQDPNFDSELVDPPIVTSLTTPHPQASGSIRAHVASLRKIQEQEQVIKQHQRKIQELEFAIAIQDAHTLTITQSEKISLTPSQPPNPIETPGPHRLQLKPECPEDIANRVKIEKQKNAEAAIGNEEPTSTSGKTEMMNIFRSLTKVLKDNNQHLQSSDVTDPTKFNGFDTQWDDFYLQLRTFFEAKGWLTTFDHATVLAHPALTTK